MPEFEQQHLNPTAFDRQSGRTTAQMKAAPRCAIFVWCNGHISYPLALASSLGRRDLEIVSPDRLYSLRNRGREISAIVLDHATQLRPEQYEIFRSIERRCKEANVRIAEHAYSWRDDGVDMIEVTWKYQTPVKELIPLIDKKPEDYPSQIVCEWRERTEKLRYASPLERQKIVERIMTGRRMTE